MASVTERPQGLVAGSVIAGRHRVAGPVTRVAGLPAAEAAELAGGLALRALPRPAEAPAREAFERAARLDGVPASPHLVRADEAGDDEALSLSFSVLRPPRGEPLEALVLRLGPLLPMLAVRAVLQACQGVEAAHQAGLSHGLLSPAALSLTPDEGRGPVVVVDLWGAAHALPAPEPSIEGLGLGGLCAAPERQQGEAPAPASDLWSLGAVLYFALSGGVAPGPGAPAHLQDVAPWVEPALASLVHGLLLGEPGARCPSVGALIEALEPFSIGASLLTDEMLRPLPAEQRGPHSRRSPMPTRWRASDEGEGPPSESLVGRKIAGRYELVRLLGRGGMGTVYEARSPSGEPCALKLVSSARLAADPLTLGRFNREARAALAIRSDHVTRTLDVDLTADPPYFVMELMRGSDLAARLRSSGPLPPAAAARLFAQAAEGLSAAHVRGYIHRDIKPANLFLHEDSEGRLSMKVCDFGIVKGGDQSSLVTGSGHLLGSPMYMAPEQFQDARSIDVRADVWSLCATLYEALSGQKPWPGGDDLAALILAVFTRDVEPLSQRAPWVPEALSAVVHRGLSLDRSGRFASMDDLRQALAPFAASQPLGWGDLRLLPPAAGEQPPPPTPSPLRSKASRARWLVGAAVVLAVAGGLLARRATTAPAAVSEPSASAAGRSAHAHGSVRGPDRLGMRSAAATAAAAEAAPPASASASASAPEGSAR